MTNRFQRFPDFGKEVRRPFEVHELCYDCAEFYDGCNAWPASEDMRTPDKKHLRCLDFLRLPDVMPGDPTGQIFPPSRMRGRREPREIENERAAARRPARKTKVVTLATREIDAKRHCVCGRPMARRRRYCDTCREVRRRETMKRFNQRHPGRSHRAAGLPQNTTESPPVATQGGATVNRYRGANLSVLATSA